MPNPLLKRNGAPSDRGTLRSRLHDYKSGPYGTGSSVRFLRNLGATTVGTIVGSVYLLRLTRKRVNAENVPSFLVGVPWLRGFLAGLLAAGGCWSLSSRFTLHGAIGMIVCSLGALPALLVFTALIVGPDIPEHLRRYLGRTGGRHLKVGLPHTSGSHADGR